jgi:hypothetical protein
MLDSCGCCKGVEKLTPATIANRPGLSALSCRIGTHWSFLQTMKARLSGGDYAELRGLSTRENDDFSMALMDAWAAIADILTFYQERIATEGYLRTAIERYSVLELARLVGYHPRPGVASSTYLAFTLEKGYELEIPEGTRAQSLPDPGELPQSFEIMEKIWAKSEWSQLLLRTAIPTVISPNPNAGTIDHLYVQGLNHELKAGFPIVFDFGDTAVARSIASVELQLEKNRTRINLSPLISSNVATSIDDSEALTADDVVKRLVSAAMSNPTAWQPQLEETFAYGSDAHLQVLSAQYMSGEDKKDLYSALGGDLLTKKPALKSIRAFGLRAQVFGYNAPPEQIKDEKGLQVGIREWAIGGVRMIEVHVKRKGRAVQSRQLPELQVEITAKSQCCQGNILVPLKEGNYDVGDELVTIKKTKTNAWVRFFHAHIDTGGDVGQIDTVLINGKKWLANIGLFSLSDYEPFPIRKEHKFKYCPPNIEMPFKFDACKRYTLMAYMDSGKAKLKCFIDDMADQNNLRVIHAVSRINNLKINGNDVAFGDEISLDLNPGENNIVGLKYQSNTIGMTEGMIELTPEEGKSYDCFLFGTGDKLEKVISERSDPIGCLGVGFIFQSKSSKKETEMEIIWNNLNPSDSSMKIKLDGELKQLKGIGELVESTQEKTIKIKSASKFDIQIAEELSLPSPESEKKRGTVFIDAPGSKIASGTWAVIDRPHETDKASRKRIFAQVDVSDPITEIGYGIQATVIPLKLREKCYQQILKDGSSELAEAKKIFEKVSPEWLFNEDVSLKVVRDTAVFAENSELPLAEEPYLDPLKKDEDIELDRLYEELEPGRLLIVSGERYDLPGVKISEPAILSGTFSAKHKDSNGVEDESDTLHTFLKLAAPLEHDYARDTVTIYANVARATHGETREEILGSGDASKDFQEFYLRQSPLTYLAAATPSGARSTLNVRVNGVLWHEKESLMLEGPKDHSFVTKTDNEDKTKTIFGNGVRAARLPTGVENVKAVYRTGIGKAGNVKANQITLLASRPLGLKGVTNPLPATGGADRDTIDQARRNIPLMAMSLDHLVSVKDYEDFAKSFAAIGKASATILSDGRRQLVHVTIAGKDNVPIDMTSDLYLNLVQALSRFGDPDLHILVAKSEQKLLIMDAEVRLKPDYAWGSVEPKIRDTLLERFGFERRELGQDVHLSEIISAMGEVEGVAYVDVNIFDAVPGFILPQSLGPLMNAIVKLPFDGTYMPNQCIYANLARIEEQYEAEGWEDFQYIKDRYENNDALNKLAENYILIWNDIPNKDKEKIKNYLDQKYGIKQINIKETSDEQIIIATESKSVRLKINSSKTEVTLELGGVEADRLRAKEENGNIKIYLRIRNGDVIPVPRTIMPAQMAFFNSNVKEMLNLRLRGEPK